MQAQGYTLGIIGGTGSLGSGLARRWARAGHRVVIGSRSLEKAEKAAAMVRGDLGAVDVSPGSYEDAASAEMVVLTVPFSQHRSILDGIAGAVRGKIVIDCTVPLKPPKVSTVQLPPAGSAAKGAQELLGPDVRVVSAFQTVAAAHLADLSHELDHDVLVCGNDPDARTAVIELVEAAGLRGWHAGPIENSAASEALTSVLIFINRQYKSKGAGITISGVPT